MPSVSRQQGGNSKPASKSASGSVLDRIQPVEVREGGLKFCSYGRGKTGKTRFACTFPKPLLLIGTEDGTQSVTDIPGVDFIRLKHSSEVDSLASYIKDQGQSKQKLVKGAWVKQKERTGEPYKSTVVDTAGGLQDMILKEILGLDDIPVEKSWGLAQREQWQSCGQQLKERLRLLLDQSDTDGINVVCIAHERNFNEEGASGDLIFPTVGAALTPSAAGWLNAAVDYIGQTYIREQTAIKEVKLAGKAHKTTAKTGKMEYCLRVGPHPVFMTGFRLPVGSAELPEAIINPSYEKIMALIKGKAG